MVAGLLSMRPLSIGSWRAVSLANLSQRRIDVACTRRPWPAGSADSKLKALHLLNAARMPAALQAWSIVAPRLPPSRITQTTRAENQTGQELAHLKCQFYCICYYLTVGPQRTAPSRHRQPPG
jgi:hypothetical protein